MAEKFDLVVIGGGPGGYVAAIRAAQLGMKVACVEKRGALGGTCLNVGCIPSKALLNASEKFAEARDHFTDFGIEVGAPKLNLKKLMGKKDSIVAGLTDGVAFLFKKNKVDYRVGTGTIEKMDADGGQVTVTDAKGATSQLVTQRILIATGSVPSDSPGLVIDEKRIVTSTGALALEQVPKHLVVIGAGVIGLELGSVWARLGAQVTVVEYLDRICPGMDMEIARKFQRVLQSQGLTFKLGHKVTGAKTTKSAVSLAVEPAAGGDSETVKADCVLVAVGRRPMTDGLNLDALGVATDKRGFIEVDEDFETSRPGIFAIGDCVPGPMLAHKAEEDGVAAVETMAGGVGHVDYNLVPSIVYTWPEVAWIGKTTEELKEAGIKPKAGSFPFAANSRARANDDTEGVVKILADPETDAVLGVHIVGPEAGNLIHECATAMAFGASSEDIARTCHGHPTLNEAVKEAALAVDKRAIHI